MKKSILASIKPKYCELIASGGKTVEIRKNRPKIDVPFKVYIYCTKLEPIILKRSFVGKGKPSFDIIPKNDVDCYNQSYVWNGKVIGEFVCDRIDDFFVCEDGAVQNWNYIKLSQSCLKHSEIAEYIGTGKFGYAWHISELGCIGEQCSDSGTTSLVIYDKPKELSEFGLTRPPQSWCYVEELEG